MENSFFHSELSMLTNLHEYQVSRAGGKSWSTARAESEEAREGWKKKKKKTNGEDETNEGLQLIKYSPILSKDYQRVICTSLGSSFP